MLGAAAVAAESLDIGTRAALKWLWFLYAFTQKVGVPRLLFPLPAPSHTDPVAQASGLPLHYYDLIV